ncbi:cardiolipin synthase B [Dulcicalothrix desertica PCC 7102]|uniref:Cardiolipin synthase B n=1 Tax=Dulcicalothrix desertica PCC 7102 TaxID=232991 RepID=A0A433VHT8_9CYAN|nr:phospholipase D-like domain-containing protein [Dulcicalothrix desertica]RUT05674.1 cardiolipin synthase B [Dulcicalothrix desertica PCC 7102]TWH39661.1 cardiolipin synthase [Dulcicalothrix desertica PCC 7102]
MQTGQKRSGNRRILNKKPLLCFGGGILSLFVIGFGFLYLRGFFRQEPEYKITNIPNLQDNRFPLLVVSLSNALATSGRFTNFWIGADAIYKARLDAIRNARNSIRFETYYMTPGRRANKFAAALIERAKAGIKVQLLIDDFGTDSISDDYWQRLRQAGAEVRFFRSFDVRAPLEYNSRTHRKLLLIDGQQALIGGAGVSDEWDGNPEIGDTAPWLDFEVSYEGEIASVLKGNFLQNWAYTGGTVDLAEGTFRSQPEAENKFYITNDTSTLSESTMRMLFQISFLAARKRIWIGSPYFVPDANTRNVLIQAKNKGIDVRVLTMGRKNDKPIVHFASRELYGELLKAGIQICEYQPSMMHAKVTLIDNSWVSAGSANFDPRSYHHNDELNVSTSNPQLVNKIENFFVKSLASSRCFSYSEWENRAFIEKMQGQLGLIVKPLL